MLEKQSWEELLIQLNTQSEASISAYQEAANSALVQALVISADLPPNNIKIQAELRKAAALLDLVEKRNPHLDDWFLPRQVLIRQLYQHFSPRSL